MQFSEFFVQYKKAHSDWNFGRMTSSAAAAEIARLRSMVSSIEPVEKQRTAEFNLGRFESEISPEAKQRMARALKAVSAASAQDGTPEERLSRAEDGIAAVTAIARDAANSSEQHAILSLNESLLMVIDILRNESAK